MEALRVVDAELADQCQGLAILNPLGDRLLAEPAGDRDDCLDELLVGGVCFSSWMNSMSIFRYWAGMFLR